MPPEDRPDLANIAPPPDPVSDQADEKTAREEEDLDKSRQTAEVADLTQNIQLRKQYAFRFFLVVGIWLGSIIVILLFQGFGSVRNWFHLSDTVLVSLLVTTTATVVSVVLIVARYLFPRSVSDSPRHGRSSRDREFSRYS